MTDHDQRLVLRGMSIGRGILITESCDHLETLATYQRLLADAWQIDDGDVMNRAEFMALVDEINDAIAAKHPDWRPRRAASAAQPLTLTEATEPRFMEELR
jgi:hypothetical protein